MCLYTAWSEPTIADEDITCYKILYQHSNNKLSAIWSNFKYELNKLYKLNEPLHPISTSEFKCEYVLNEGFHSYVNLEDSIKEFFDYSYFFSAITIAKCIIPKGSEYFIGIHDKHKNYCSDSIIIKEILDTNK